MMKILFSIFLFLLFIPTGFEKCFAQQQSVIDSLLQVLEASEEDTTKVKTLIKLSQEYCYTNIETSKNYVEQGLALAKASNFKPGIASALNTLGIINILQGNYDNAIELLLKSEQIHEALGNKKGVASILGNIGSVYQAQGNYEKALEYHFKCLRIDEELEDKEGMAITFNNIGIVNYFQRNYTKAQEYYTKALKINEELGKDSEAASNINNIAIIYEIEGNLEGALEYYIKALSIYEKLGHKRGITEILGGIGSVYRDQGDYEKAKEYYLKAINLKEELGDRFGYAADMANLALVNYKSGDYESSIEYNKKSLKIGREIGAKEVVKEAYKDLSEAYAALGKHQEAYEYQQMYIQAKDSIYNEEKSKQIEELQTKYETEKKEKENELLTKQNEIQTLQISRNRYLIYGLTGVVVLVMIIAFLFIQQNKLRAVQRSMELEQKLLRSQMNPHFIFNSLIAIQGYIYKKDPKEAGKYLAGFAKLMRLILENSREEYVTLEKEIQTLEHYLELQGLRFENKFDYSIDIDSSIDTETLAIPPMLAQPFIENALEHGILHKDTGKINVRFSLEGGLVLLEVEDNGIGRQKAEEQKQDYENVHKSLATTITQERLAILNKKNRQKIKLEITDLKSPDDEVMGTKATFSIPFRNI